MITFKTIRCPWYLSFPFPFIFLIFFWMYISLLFFFFFLVSLLQHDTVPLSLPVNDPFHHWRLSLPSPPPTPHLPLPPPPLTYTKCHFDHVQSTYSKHNSLSRLPPFGRPNPYRRHQITVQCHGGDAGK